MAILLILKISVAALIFAVGVGATHEDLLYLWRRPAQLMRALLAMYVVVPLGALLMVSLLPLTLPVETAIVVLAISAGAPLLPRKVMKLGRAHYVLSLVVTTSLLAIIVVPAWLMVIGPWLGIEKVVEPRVVALSIGKGFLLPLIAGMLVRPLLRGAADRVSEVMLAVAGIALALATVVRLWLNPQLVLQMGWVALLALTGLSLLSLAVGYLLGGPDPLDRTALAVSCTTRNVGVAILASSVTPGPQTVTMVLTYLVAASVVSLLYLRLRRPAPG